MGLKTFEWYTIKLFAKQKMEWLGCQNLLLYFLIFDSFVNKLLGFLSGTWTERQIICFFFKTKTEYLGLRLKLDSSVLNIKPEHLLLQVDRIR